MLADSFVFKGGSHLRIGLGKRERHAIGHACILARFWRPPTQMRGPERVRSGVCAGLCYRAFMRTTQLVLAILLAGALGARAQSAVDPALLARANAGDAAAQVAAGEAYAKAAGAADDPDVASEDWNKSAEWYIKAAAQNNLAGEIHLAEAYSYGHGVPRDKVKAANWYRKAAEQGDPGAQGTLGMLYSLGQGVPQDDAEAYFWFDLAASADTPNRERYVMNRQNVGTRITADQLAVIQRRVKNWQAEHPRAAESK